MGSIRDAADFLEQAATRAQERGEHESAVDMLKGALMVRSALDIPETKKLLQRGKHFPTIDGMHADHRAAISEGRSKRNPMLKAARAAGYATLGDLAAAVNAEGYRLKAPFLSKVSTGTKPLPEDLGRILKRLIDWEP